MSRLPLRLAAARRATPAPREISTEILVDTDARIDFLETRLALLSSLGEQNDLQSGVGGLGES